MSVSIVVAGLIAAAASAAEPYHKTARQVGYKCVFNHELLIVAGNKNNSPAYVKAFVEKLKATDVDAILCCPTLWRANFFPSRVDLTWKKYRPGQPLSKFPTYDYAMRYLHSGGDPVRDTLEACRACNKDFFISYRMNDHHYVTDLEWPCHNDFWREHRDYWLGDSDTSPYTKRDDVRLFNYLHAGVRDYYFAIIEELCANYDVDGVELDFQRFPKFFPSDKLAEGTPVMTAFVERIRRMLDRLGTQRGKSLKLCVRVPETLDKCREAGLDVPGWDARGLVDMIGVSSFYRHTMELGIEEFKAALRHAKVYAEMNYLTHQAAADKFARRYTTFEIYRASALNFFQRGADGLYLFNYDYVPADRRVAMAEGLKRITDVEYLRGASKDYVVYAGFGSLAKPNQTAVELVVPDDTTKVKFQRAALRVETRKSSANLRLAVRLNGRQLEPCQFEGTELFPPLANNAGYPTHDVLQFFAVPLDALVPGKNRLEVENLDKKKAACQFFSLELGLYRPKE